MRDSVADTRRIVDDLRPAALADLGQLPAVQELAGVGLTSMHQRATELGGTCTVTGGSDGTAVVATLPADLPAQPSPARLADVAT